MQPASLLVVQAERIQSRQLLESARERAYQPDIFQIELDHPALRIQRDSLPPAEVRVRHPARRGKMCS